MLILYPKMNINLFLEIFHICNIQFSVMGSFHFYPFWRCTTIFSFLPRKLFINAIFLRTLGPLRGNGVDCSTNTIYEYYNYVYTHMYDGIVENACCRTSATLNFQTDLIAG
jgi:hypothetical protein